MDQKSKRPERSQVSAETTIDRGTGWRIEMAEGVLKIESDPIRTFERWLREAKELPVAEPTAMTLATADKEGRPHARIVLFKGTSLDVKGWEGIEFYTNLTSPKSKQLIENPFAALVFHWPQLRRQIRFEGRVEQLTPAESDVYFQSRARGSRMGAWSSPQSQKIGNRAELEDKVHATETRFGDGPIPCPPFWGGWRLLPQSIEFWEERPSRLHERRLFERQGQSWTDARLAP